MFMKAFAQAFEVIKKKPLRLFGLSILSGVIGFFAILFTLGMPVIGIAFSMVISAGMSKVFLDGIEGKQVYSDQLFYGFRSGKAFIRTAGGLAWQGLWNAIWVLVTIVAIALVVAICSIIPVVGGIIGVILGVLVFIAGAVLCCIKSYSYSFVPYILMTETDVTATEALRLSVKLTNGKKGQLFLADLIFGVAMFVIGLVFGALGMIPYVGVLFVIVGIIITVISPLFSGLYWAAFYKFPQPVVTQANPMEKIENALNQ